MPQPVETSLPPEAHVPFVPPPVPVSVESPGAGDVDSAVMDGALSGPFDEPSTKDLERRTARLLGVASGNELGRFAASRLLGRQKGRESEVLHHRAKVAFVDSASLCVTRFYSELGKKKPNKVVLDACLAAMRGAGIVVDTIPLSTKDKAKERQEDRARTDLSTAELAEKVQERLASTAIPGAEK